MKTSKPQKRATKDTRTRKPGNERRREIAQVAAQLFAQHGFLVSTRAISDALGISQAALYKHFKSKQALQEEIFRTQFLDDKASDFSHNLNQGNAPLEIRLTTAYTGFFNAINETSLRLFQRASYDGLEIAKRYSPHLDERILSPVLENLRHEAKLPTIEQKAVLSAERELALMLHSTVVFLAMRKFVYRIEFDGKEAAIIRLHVTTWLPGALMSLQTMHEV